ncbi:MAG: sodium:solute symporter [Gemmatimonadales bacterium]
MHTVDWLVAATYLALVVALGTTLGRRQQGASDYFLGRHGLPWWAVLISVVATETSALTVISIPGIGYRGDLTFLQLAFGYLIGRIAVAWLLLPGYFTGDVQTAYQVLGNRWGAGARRVSSGVFLLTRAAATSVRLFAGAIPLAVITGWPYPAAILAVGVATVIYTYVGGIRAVVWVDVVQWTVYVIAGAAALYAATRFAPGALAAAAAAGKLRVFSPGISLTDPYAFGTAVLGGAFLSAASHGTDHLIVQRLLATRSLRDARRALVGSGVVVIAEFALFLLVGAALWTAYPAGRMMAGDAVFPGFVSTRLAGGLGGLVVAGILAAAMGSTASALNSLASATTHDYYAPLAHRQGDELHLLRVGRLLTLGWAVLLVGGALLFRHRDAPVVVVALSIASLTYGALLGAFALARVRRVRERDAVIALITGSLLMAIVVFAGALGGANGPTVLAALARLAWPWYVPVGLAITMATGLISSLIPSRASSRASAA